MIDKIPSNLGWGVTVLAKIATLAPSFAAFLAIARPIPLDPPVTTIVFPFKFPTFSNEKGTIFLRTKVPAPKPEVSFLKTNWDYKTYSLYIVMLAILMKIF